MTSAQGGRILSRSFTRRIGTRRHLLATSIASIVLALQPITSVDVRQASPPWSGVPVRVTVEATARICLPHSGCASLTAGITPR